MCGLASALHRGVLDIERNGMDLEQTNELNMEKEQDFFSKLVETLPKEYIWLIMSALGALFFTGACRRWKWVLDQPGIKWKSGFLPLIYSWLGEKGVRIGVMIMSVIMMICGVVMFLLTR